MCGGRFGGLAPASPGREHHEQSEEEERRVGADEQPQDEMNRDDLNEQRGAAREPMVTRHVADDRAEQAGRGGTEQDERQPERKQRHSEDLYR